MNDGPVEHAGVAVVSKDEARSASPDCGVESRKKNTDSTDGTDGNGSEWEATLRALLSSASNSDPLHFVLSVKSVFFFRLP